ncbi:hypothetical protein APY03_5727 [Variovorax sp. WDL1]|nr:hypothetical protein APY03_5727 [Variovorax sp. WDL1]
MMKARTMPPPSDAAMTSAPIAHLKGAYFASPYIVARDTPMCAAAISMPRRMSK